MNKLNNLKYHAEFDKSPYRLFLLPSTSKELAKAGLSMKVILWWDFFQNGNLDCYNLRTFFWDYDAYYSSSQELIDSINKREKFPAYSVADIEALLPPHYFFEKDNNEYTLSLHDMWKMEPVKSNRMADCFGLMLLQMIVKKVLSVEELNKKLELAVPGTAG